MDFRREASEFLRAKRDRLTPDKAGIPFYGGSRRVVGLRREEVAMLAGISVDYYTKLERGNLVGVSDSVLESLSDALQLNSEEREHLLQLVRIANQSGLRSRKAKVKEPQISEYLHQTLHKLDMPAVVMDIRMNIVATNPLGRALYQVVFQESSQPNLARFCFFSPTARTFWLDWKTIAWGTVAALHQTVGQFPNDQALLTLIGELCSHSEEFAKLWTSQDVKNCFSGEKTFLHPQVGRLDLHYESLMMASDPRMRMTVYSAVPESTSADALEMLAGIVATEATEKHAQKA